VRSTVNIIQIVQSHFALAGKNVNIIRVEHVTLALLHYSGGCPVPRAESLYTTAVCEYTLTYTQTRGSYPLLSLVKVLFLTVQIS